MCGLGVWSFFLFRVWLNLCSHTAMWKYTMLRFSSLPSEERMVVIARGRKADSGSTEFAIMLHDNSTCIL